MKLALAHRGYGKKKCAEIAADCYAQAKKCFDMGMAREAARYFAYAEIYETKATQP